MIQESLLQHKCFIWANNTYKKGITWAVLNENHHHKMAVGVRKGVSDMHHFCDGTLSVAELKVKGSWHDVKHLLQQIKYIDSIIANGGRGTFIYTLEQYQQFITGKSDFPEHLEFIREITNNAKTKSVKV